MLQALYAPTKKTEEAFYFLHTGPLPLHSIRSPAALPWEFLKFQQSRTASEMRSSPYRSARVTNAETAPEAHDVVTRSRADDLGSTCSAPYHQPVELFDREVAGFLEQSSLSTGLRTAECMRQHAQLKSLRGRPHFASVLCNPSAPSLRWHAGLSAGQLDQQARDLVHAPARSWIRAYTKLVEPKMLSGIAHLSHCTVTQALGFNTSVGWKCCCHSRRRPEGLQTTLPSQSRKSSHDYGMGGTHIDNETCHIAD